MANPIQFLRFQKQWEAFRGRHPKIIRYFTLVADRHLKEGTVLDITTRDPDGQSIHANLKLTAEDAEVLTQLKALLSSKS